MAKIQFITRNNSGCDYFRCTLPFIYLDKDTEWSKDNSVEMLWIGQEEWKIDCDILVYNKLIATPVETLKEFQANGMKLVVDIDDYWRLPDDHANFEWNKAGLDKLTIEHMKMADLVICTSIRLQDKIREFNKNTIVIPNALPFGSGVYQPLPKEKNKTTFLYAGGVAHSPDVQLLKGAFSMVKTNTYIKDNSKFILAGYEKAKQKKYRTKEDMEQQTGNFIIKDVHGPYDDMKAIFARTGNFRVIPTASVTEYINCYDLAHVGLIPLRGTEWGSYKSELKLLECAAKGIPAICSSVHPYSDLRPIEGVMWVETSDDWYRYIKKCVKEKDWVKEQGIQMTTAIQELFHLDKWNKVRAQVLNSLI